MSLAIAVIGGGLIGREHLARIRTNPRCRVAALVDPAAAAAHTAREGGHAYFASLDAMLQGALPDAAIVATPNALHVEQAVALLGRGVPVLVEKPVADSVAAGQQLLRAVHDTGVALLVGHHRRHSAAIVAARACIASGALGRVVAVNATTLFHKPAAYFDPAWRRQAGGGPVLINAVHDIDSLRALLGDIVALQARCTNAVRGLEVEDSAAVLLEFASGALGTLLLSDTAVSPRSWEQTSGENPAYARDPTQDSLFISGTGGSLGVPTMTLWRQSGPGSWSEPFQTTRLALVPVDPLARQLDHFCDMVEHGVAPLVGAADALNTLAATLAIHQAAASAARVTVPRFE